jgi:hypothetical protein
LGCARARTRPAVACNRADRALVENGAEGFLLDDRPPLLSTSPEHLVECRRPESSTISATGSSAPDVDPFLVRDA